MISNHEPNIVTVFEYIASLSHAYYSHDLRETGMGRRLSPHNGGSCRRFPGRHPDVLSVFFGIYGICLVEHNLRTSHPGIAQINATFSSASILSAGI